MDLIIYCGQNKFIDVLEKLGFKIIKRDNYTEARKIDGFERYHIYFFSQDEGKIGCEIHQELLIHFLFLGVDYKNGPLMLFNNKIRPLIINEIDYEILNGYSWWNRRNKAIIRGFQIWSNRK